MNTSNEGTGRWPARIGRQVAAELLTLLGPSCERLCIAGSLRRNMREIGDLDLVCIPKVERVKVPKARPSMFDPDPIETHETDLLTARVRELIDQGRLALRPSSIGRVTFGDLNKLLIHTATELPVDIFSTTHENWGMALLKNTGPKEFNVRVMIRFKELGMQGHAYGGVSTDSGEIQCPKEETVFQLLRWSYIDPEKRR